MDKDEKIRIQFADFQNKHFDVASVWEFAIDEEGEDDQDETTLKPRYDINSADASEGLLIVQCKFTTKSGKTFSGLCSPSFEDSLSSIQPYILVDNDFIMFWFGIMQPNNQTKKKVYDTLHETSETLFPIKFESVLTKPDGQKISGQINGFMWRTLADNKVMTDK